VKQGLTCADIDGTGFIKNYVQKGGQ
jgi:hypothetical protein